MGMMNWMGGWTLCRVSGASPAAFLNRCAAEGVEVNSARARGSLELLVRLRTRDLRRAERAALAVQCALEPLGPGGMAALRSGLLRRWFVVLGLTAALLLLFWSRMYIWEIRVSGNETVSTGRILDGLRECGVTYGSFWPGIVSDNLRSELLSVVPELAWATVNIYGSRAEVIVRERVPVPALWDPEQPVDIRAEKAGFVVQVRVLNGEAQVKPGKAVTPGDLLIAGSAQNGYGGSREFHAAGSVVADTYYELSAVIPREKMVKRYTGQRKTRWGLNLGKNRFYFFQNSSISGADCDTITRTWNAALGELFSLPLGLLRETELEYTLEETERAPAFAERLLREELHRRLLAELSPGGEVLSENYSLVTDSGKITVCLRATCREEIGTEVPAG